MQTQEEPVTTEWVFTRNTTKKLTNALAKPLRQLAVRYICSTDIGYRLNAASHFLKIFFKSQVHVKYLCRKFSLH